MSILKIKSPVLFISWMVYQRSIPLGKPILLALIKLLKLTPSVYPPVTEVFNLHNFYLAFKRIVCYFLEK
jgi:hypothetical protein